MARWVSIAVAIGVAAFVGVIAMQSCRSSPRTEPPDHREGAPAARLPEAPAPAEDHGVQRPPAPAPRKTPIQEAEMVLAAHGIAPPKSDEDLAAAYRALIGMNDAELRNVLDALATILSDAKDWKTSHRRADLPDEFGARLLRLLTPLLHRQVDLRRAMETGQFDEELVFGAMLLRVLETMQYLPALQELMRPEGVPALGDNVYWSWPEFGRAAVSALADKARAARAQGDTTMARIWAIDDIRRIRDPDAATELQRLLDDKDPEIRAAAMEALRELGVPMDVSRFRSVLDDAHSAIEDREQAALNIAKLGGAADLDALMGFVDNAVAARAPRGIAITNPVQCAIRGLVQRHDPKAMAWIFSLVERKGMDEEANREIRESAVDVLGAERVAEARIPLLAVMNDEGENLHTRMNAALSLTRVDPANESVYSKRCHELRDRLTEQQKHR